jgi:predicted ATP-grasp superfamily ATP-dependent carboligase
MRALVIGSNATLLLNVVQALGAAGDEADVMSDWSSPRARFSRYCRRYIHVPYQTLDLASPEVAQRVEQYCQTNAIDVVIPADLKTAIAAATQPAITTPFFPVASVEALETLHDKWSFHTLLTRLGLPSPQTQRLDAATDWTQLTFPLLVKPSQGEGGHGIVRCDTREALDAHYAAADTAPQLVQTLIPGRDVDISVLADHGRVVAFSIQEDTAADTKLFTQDERMLQIASEVMRDTAFHGLAHFDMRIDERDGALYVIECNPRVWGSLMYSVWGGVNFIELGCQLALGRKVPRSTPPSGPVWHQGVAPRRLLKALLRGRTAPTNLNGATLASWRQAHADPLPQLCGTLTEQYETRLRTLLDSPWLARLQPQTRRKARAIA